jgi:hypothetical protein
MWAQTLLLTAVSALSTGGCGGAGFLGLQDYQRDVLFGIGGGLAGALITNNAPPATNGGDTGREDPGPPGPAGPQGPPGPPIFSIYVDTFFGGMADDIFGIVPVRVDEPSLGSDAGPLAFSVAIPSNFAPGNSVSMRLVMFREGPCDGGCFVFTLDARRAQTGDSQPQCFGGLENDCSDGTRWVLVDDICTGAEEGIEDLTQLLIIDLPLDGDGLGLPAVMPADLLAFELSTASGDGGTYHVLGIEFADTGVSLSPNATVFGSLDQFAEVCPIAP